MYIYSDIRYGYKVRRQRNGKESKRNTEDSGVHNQPVTDNGGAGDDCTCGRAGRRDGGSDNCGNAAAYILGGVRLDERCIKTDFQRYKQIRRKKNEIFN